MADENITQENQETNQNTPPPEESRQNEEENQGENRQQQQSRQESHDDDDEGIQLSDAEKMFAKQILDPKTSEQTLRMIAASMGLQLVDSENADRNRQKETSLEDELAAELGDDYGFLGPKIGKVFAKRLEAIENKFESKLATDKATAQTNALRRAEKRFFDDNPEARKLRKQMVKLASDYPIPQGKDANQYVRDLYKMAGGTDDGNSITSANRRNQRIDQNRSGDVDTTREGAPGATVRKVKGRIKLRDAVLAASKGETLERED